MGPGKKSLALCKLKQGLKLIWAFLSLGLAAEWSRTGVRKGKYVLLERGKVSESLTFPHINKGMSHFKIHIAMIIMSYVFLEDTL